jgi:hypothetical protein
MTDHFLLQAGPIDKHHEDVDCSLVRLIAHNPSTARACG